MSTSQIPELTTATFDQALAKTTRPVLVEFTATWCPPCRLLAKDLAALATDLAGRLDVVAVNIDDEPALADRYGVRAAPTLIGFRGGAPVLSRVGALPKPALRALAEELVG